MQHEGGRVIRQPPQRRGDMGRGADAEREVAGVGAYGRQRLAVRAQPGGLDREHAVFRVPGHGVDPVAEAGGGEFGARPAQVVVELRAVDVEPLGEVEREEPAADLDVIEVGPGARGLDQAHQVRQEGHLEGGSLDQQARVPAEGGALLVEGGAQPRYAVGERGEREVEGPHAHPQQVEGRRARSGCHRAPPARIAGAVGVRPGQVVRVVGVMATAFPSRGPRYLRPPNSPARHGRPPS